MHVLSTQELDPVGVHRRISSPSTKLNINSTFRTGTVQAETMAEEDFTRFGASMVNQSEVTNSQLVDDILKVS
jgi:hypothetical protein